MTQLPVYLQRLFDLVINFKTPFNKFPEGQRKIWLWIENPSSTPACNKDQVVRHTVIMMMVVMLMEYDSLFLNIYISSSL